MNSESIYAILATKPHNPHYLKRYFKFIQWCQENPTVEDYTEEHHICPKSDDLFPKYTSFTLYEWNCVVLSARQHILAHILLWKSYGGKSVLPVNYMLNVQNSETGYNDRKVPTAIQIRYAASAKSGFGDWRKGKSTFKDSEGNKYFLETTDALIKELGLVGNNSGHLHSEESKQKMSETKLPNKVVKIFKLDQKKTIKLYSQEFAAHINDGWHTELTDEDREYIQSQSNQKLSEFWTNRMRYMDSTGTYHGSYLKDDPIIQELNLVPLRTQAQIEQNASRTSLATEARTGSNIYNNGIEEKFLLEPIDGSWVLGRLPYSEQGMKNRADGTREACLGTKTYNNGKVNMFIKDGEHIPEGFKPGGKCRPNTTYWYIKDDRSDVISFLGQHDAPDGYFFSNERDAGVVLRLKRESEMFVTDKDSAVTFVKYCMHNGKFNVNRSELFTKHKQPICDVYGLSTSLKNPTIAKHVLTGSEIKKCRCCGTHIEDSMIYCSTSCGSKMKYK